LGGEEGGLERESGKENGTVSGKREGEGVKDLGKEAQGSRPPGGKLRRVTRQERGREHLILEKTSAAKEPGFSHNQGAEKAPSTERQNNSTRGHRQYNAV